MAKVGGQWRRRTPQQWQELLERQAASGQSVEAFCRAQSVTTASFYRWRKQLGTKGASVEAATTTAVSAPPAFVELGALDGAVGRGWELELTLGEAVVLRLRGG